MEKLRKILFSTFISLLLLPSLALADGVPLPPPEKKIFDFSAVKQRQQYASVEVLSNFFQRTNLFLSLTSLDQKKRDVTLVVPFTSIPTKVDAHKLSSQEFLKKNEIEKVKELSEKQSFRGVVKKTSPLLRDYIFDYLSFSLITPLYKWAGKMPLFRPTRRAAQPLRKEFPGVEKIAEYEFEGGKLELFNVDSGYTLKNFLKKYKRLEAPSNIQEAIDKYGRHYIGVITLEVGPITDVSLLGKYAPKAFKKAKDFINAHPDLTLKCKFRRSWVRKACTARSQLKKKFSDLISEAEQEAKEKGISELELRRRKGVEAQLLNFLEAAYSGKVKGVELSLTLPMEDQELFYPLGTSAAWATPINDIKILVKMPKSLTASFPRAQFKAIGDNNRLFLYEFKSWNPSFDISSKVRRAGFLEGAGDSWARLMSAFYENSLIVALVWLGIILIGIGAIMYWLCLIESEGAVFRFFRLEKRADLKYLILGAIFAPLISIWGFFLLVFGLRTKPDVEEIKTNLKNFFKYYMGLAIVLAIVALIAFLVGG